MQITFEDFLLKLARQQLKNTAAVDESQSGCINPEYREHFLDLTNQGLVDLTTRKKLFEETNILTFVDGQNIYPLDTTALTGEYDRLVRVFEIVTSDERVHLPKTNVHITQPNQETLRFSSAFMDCHKPTVDIRYQVTHPEIAEDGVINLPSHLHETLSLYVAGLYLAHMGGEEHKARGDSYYGLYLKQCIDDVLENASGLSEVTDEDTRFCDRGFV